MSADQEVAKESGESGAGCDFVTVAKLGAPGSQAAADNLKAVCAELAASGVHTAVQRLHDIDKTVRDLPFPVIERLVAPERVLAEFAEERGKPVGRLHIWRNQAALLPLLITWLSLSLAVFSPQHVNEWMLSTLPWVALVDAVLIGSIVYLTWQMHRKESAVARESDRIARQLDLAMTSLAIAVEHNAVRSPATPKQWASAVQKVIRDALQRTSDLAEANREVVENAQAAVESTKAATEQLIKGLAEQSTATLKSFQETHDHLVERTIKEATTVLREAVAADRSLINDQMAPLVAQFRSSVDDFTTSYGVYQTSTSTFVEVVSELGTATQGLADSAKSHAGTAESIEAHLRTIEEAQSTFTHRVTESVQSMGTAATAMETVSTLLHDRLRSDLEEIAGKLHSSSERMADVDGNLTGTTEALTAASHELRDAATALGRASGARRPWLFGSRRREQG